MRIAFTGTHSTGKSTLIDSLSPLYPQLRVIKSTTRDLLKRGLKINEEADDTTQLYTLRDYITQALPNNTLLDRCMIDGLAYTQYMYEIQRVERATYEMAKILSTLYLDRYDIIFYIPPTIELEDDKVRSMNMKFRTRIDTIIQEEVKSYSKVVEVYPVNLQERVQYCQKHIDSL